jgi:predicted membrane protein
MSTNELPVSYRRTGKSSDRSFGFIIAIFFAVVAILPLLRGGQLRLWAIALSIALLLCAVVLPRALSPFNRAWHRLGMAMHAVINPVVMGLIFYCAIVPMGIILRLRGKDLLRLKWTADAKSYWIERVPPGPAPASMSKQF